MAALAADLPTGGQVVSGSGAISQPNAQQMIIDQSSNKLAINWQSFDIGAGKRVTFNQPGSEAIALNRVVGSDGSKIMGQLDANGRVFLVNPNGVLFGSGAQVQVGGLVASTLDIDPQDFERGHYRFRATARRRPWSTRAPSPQPTAAPWRCWVAPSATRGDRRPAGQRGPGGRQCHDPGLRR